MLAFYLLLIDDHSGDSFFEKLYMGNRRRMLLIAESVLHNREDAEDAVQNAFVAIARHVEKLARMDERAVEVYIAKCAKNAALNMLAERKKRDEVLPLEDYRGTSGEDVPEQYLVHENYEVVRAALSSLPAIYRDVLTLYYVNGLKPRDIASSLGRPVETVKSQIKRGRNMLFEKIREVMPE